MSHTMRWLVLIACVALAAGDVAACTTVCFTDGPPVVAYNYDFHAPDGMVVVNPRGLAKTSGAESHPHSWTSRYGSLTFMEATIEALALRPEQARCALAD